MATRRIPMPDMGRVQNQTTFRQLDNVRAARIDGDIPRTSGMFADGLESLAKLGVQIAGQQSRERDEAAEKAKQEDQKIQAILLQQNADNALIEFQSRLDNNPDKLDDDDWISKQADELLEGKTLDGINDDFLKQKGEIVFRGGVERLVSGNRNKAADARKTGIVSDALIRISNDMNGAIANAPDSKDALVATGKATLENILNGVGMTKQKALPMLVAIAQRDAKEGKHNSFLASVLKDDPDLPAETRMQMETFEQEAMAKTAIERELARSDLYAKLQPTILDGTYTVTKGREWVEKGLITAETNISWANQARANLERARKDAEERRKAAQGFSQLAAAGNSVEAYLSLTKKEQRGLMNSWQQALQQKYGDQWVGPYLAQLRSVGAVDDDIDNLSKAAAASLTGLVAKDAEVPGAVRALLQNPKVVAAYKSGDLGRHMNLETAQRIIPMLDKFHKVGPDAQGQSNLVDSFNLGASNSLYKPPKEDTLKEVKSKVLNGFKPGFWSSLVGGPQADTSAWVDAERYAASAYERRIADGASPDQAAKQTKVEMEGMFTKGSKGYVPTEIARLHPRGADGVSDLIDTQIKELSKSFNGKPGEFKYTYSNGRLFFMRNGIVIHNATLSANTVSSGKGEEFVRDSARKEIKK